MCIIIIHAYAPIVINISLYTPVIFLNKLNKIGSFDVKITFYNIKICFVKFYKYKKVLHLNLQLFPKLKRTEKKLGYT